MPRGSAAWIVAIVGILAFITGAFVFTAVDPVMTAIFNSPLWESSTTHGSNALKWQKRAWLFAPTGVMLAILMTIWIETRQTA